MIKSYTKNEVIAKLKNDCKNIKLKKHIVMIEDAVNHVLSMDIVSKEDIPLQDIADTYGYALNHEGLYSVDYYDPIRFDITNNLTIGKNEVKKVQKGDKIPFGADCVVESKYVKEYGSYITVNKPIAKYSGVSLMGSRIKQGETVIKKDTLLNSFHIALLASLNEFMVEVYKSLKVGIISNGSKLIKVRDSSLNKERDLNYYIVSNLLREDNCIPINYGIYESADKSVLDKAVKECDIVVILNYDKNRFFLDSDEAYYEDILVAPSDNTLVYNINDTFVYVLDSNPKDVMIGYKELLKPVIDTIFKIDNSYDEYIEARSLYNIPSRKGMDEYIFVKLSKQKDEICFEAVDFDASYSVLLRDSDGYIEIERNKEEVFKDEVLKVKLLKG